MIENLEELEQAEAKNALKEYEIPINWIGYKYIITGIPLVIKRIENNEKIIMQVLYKEIARKHKTTANKVCYAIRYLRENTNLKEKMKCGNLTNQSLFLMLAMFIMEKLNL